MEHITNIEIKNFKSIRHQKIQGCKRINVFVGKPNVGKSNIIEAMSLASYIDIDFKGDLKDLMRFENVRDLFTFGQSEKPIEILLGDQSIRFEYLKDDQSKFTWLIKSDEGDNEWETIHEKTFIATQPDSKISKLSLGKVNRKFFKFGELKEDIGLKVRKYVFTNSPFNKDYSVLELQSPFGDNLFEVLIYNNDLRKEFISLIKSSGAKLLFDKQKNDLKVYYQLDESIIYSVAFNSIADTLQRLIFHKAAIKLSSNSILLFEEPESHLFAPYITKFTSDIIYDERKNQYFIATHSPYVLNNFMEDAKDDLAIFLVDYKEGETFVCKMSDGEMHDAYQFGHDFFMNLENFMPNNSHEQV